MALDHYVSQVHLRKFYDSERRGLIAFDKDTDKSAVRSAKRVCRTDEGNTNDYLTEPRIIEEFLKPIENGYNNAVTALELGKISHDVIYNIGGFAAYIIRCSPAAMRMQRAMLHGIVRNTAKLADAKGMIPNAPKALGGKSATELIGSGEVLISVDEKYPQAIGIADVERSAVAFGNCHWEVLTNEHADSPFFTSDYPCAIERHQINPLKRVFPLTPTLAVRIIPSNYVPPIDATHYDFRRFSMSQHRLTRHEAIAINRRLVQCAERHVFSNHEQPWVADFISKNRNFRVEINLGDHVNERGIMMQTDQAIVPFARPL
ncbi:DUF4238 domain-containing protein [Sphingomonas pruni]|uniref:DUF4238 domain-containing protein n=1 Tax=Sphingomonas pruni TaxID=40683 RepID=UPI0008318AF8|nr:DUF4238 domain-containing protein [Sphingomonas pruni]